MTHPHPLAHVIAASVVAADKPRRVRRPSWQRRASAEGGVAVCTYCLSPVDIKNPYAAELNYLVPPSLGGPDLADNLVLSCLSCPRSKGHRDLVAWVSLGSRTTPDNLQALLNRRQEMLSHSLNHLTQTPPRGSREAFLAALHSRWEHPRFTVYAFHGVGTSWLGWTPRNGADDAHALASVLLRFGCQAVPHSAGKLTLYEVASDRLLDALWVLIDHHAIVRPLTIEGLEAEPFDADDWRHYWPVLLDDLADLRRRRPRLPGSYTRGPRGWGGFQSASTAPPPALPSTPTAGIPTATPAPVKPRELSLSRPAIALRKKREEKRYRQKLGEWLEARANLNAFKENVRLGRVEAPTLQEWDLMEREVLDMFPTRKRPPRKRSRLRGRASEGE